MRSRTVLVVSVLIAACCFLCNMAQAQTSWPFYVSFVAASGPIDGSVNIKGREKTVVGYSLSHEVSTPRDASGTASGKAQHKAITLVLDLDRATPLLLNAWSRNESLTSVTIRCYELGTGGSDVNGYTITLTNAAISSIQTAIGPGRPNPQFPTSDSPSGTSNTDLVKVTLVYQQMNVSFNGTGATTWQGNW